jgi:GT2 family glycosyltransferase
MKYKIIIPTFRENDQLNKCLKWLEKSNKLKNVIVVDDNDDSYKLITPYDVDVIKTGGNFWWSGSINLGLNKARDLGCEFVILLNSDNWGSGDQLAKLIDRTERNLNIIHAASVVNQDNIVRCTTGYINIEDYSVKMFNHNRKKDELSNKTYYGNYNGGMGVAIPINIINDIGLLDENLPLSADREYFYRAFTHGVPVCGYEDIKINTDDRHKAIDRGKVSSNKIIKKINAIFNLRSPIYYKTVFYFYNKFTNRPFSLTFFALFNYLIPWKK